VGLAVGLARFANEALPQAMDVAHALLAGLWVWLCARWARRAGGTAPVAALGSAAAVLPWAPFAEVDLGWVCAAAAALGASEAVATGLVAVAVACSPTALLATPWIAVARGERSEGGRVDARPVVIGAALAVVSLLVGTGGGWWFGHRGVGSAPLPDLLRAGRAWAGLLPVGLLPLAGVATLALGPPRPPSPVLLLAACALLAAPADVPAHLPLAGTLAVAAAVGWRRLPSRGRAVAGAVLAAQLLSASLTLAFRVESVREQERVLAGLRAALGPDDAVVAPFTWGARLSVRATRDPYGLRWRPADAPLRDQATRWCATPIARVAVLPPGARWGAGSADADGIWWTRGADPAVADWCDPRGGKR